MGALILFPILVIGVVAFIGIAFFGLLLRLLVKLVVLPLLLLKWLITGVVMLVVAPILLVVGVFLFVTTGLVLAVPVLPLLFVAAIVWFLIAKGTRRPAVI